jgi:predicted methyltransferase
METLRFFGLQPRMTVVDFWPGSGWYTEILAPYLAEGAGHYIAAGFQTGPGADPAQVQLMAAFQQRFTADRKLYGEIELTAFGPTSGPVAPAGTADLVLFMRNIHAWMAAGIAEKAFADAWAALRPGGVLGVEQHRLVRMKIRTPPPRTDTSRKRSSNSWRRKRASSSSPRRKSTRMKGIPRIIPSESDTLPPQRLTAPRGSSPDAAFDRTKYDQIGESDRMTLKFRKPE